MALITDYATLVTAVGDYLNRADLTTFIPNFLQNSQLKLYKRIRSRANEAALTVTVTSGTGAVPADYLELRYAYVTSAPIRFLERSTPEDILRTYPTRSGGEKPSLIGTSGDTFIFGPYPSDCTLNGMYYKMLPLLSSGNTTNWFTINAPEILLYGGLLEAEPFLIADERIPLWKAGYDDAYAHIERLEKREKASGSALRTRIAGAVF